MMASAAPITVPMKNGGQTRGEGEDRAEGALHPEPVTFLAEGEAGAAVGGGRRRGGLQLVDHPWLGRPRQRSASLSPAGSSSEVSSAADGVALARTRGRRASAAAGDISGGSG